MAKKAAKKTGKKRVTKQDVSHLFGKDYDMSTPFGKAFDMDPKLDSYEEVVHPKHYNGLPNGVECWDVVEHFPTNVGSAIKYLWRAGQKPGQDTVKDLKKALQWTQRQIDLLEGKNPNMGIKG